MVWASPVSGGRWMASASSSNSMKTAVAGPGCDRHPGLPGLPGAGSRHRVGPFRPVVFRCLPCGDRSNTGGTPVVAASRWVAARSGTRGAESRSVSDYSEFAHPGRREAQSHQSCGKWSSQHDAFRALRRSLRCCSGRPTTGKQWPDADKNAPLLCCGRVTGPQGQREQPRTVSVSSVALT